MSQNNHPTVLTLPNIRLKDERTVFFLDFFRLLMSWKLRGHIEQLYVQNMTLTQEVDIETGAVLAPNHISRWDASLFLTLSEHIGKRAFVFVPHTILAQFPFLRWCGAIPLYTEYPSQAIAQLKQTHKLSEEPTQFWIFPQGQYRPPHLPSLRFKEGATILANHVEYPVIPVAIQYLYRDSKKPTAYISFRPPLPYHCSVNDIEGSVKRGLKEIDQFHLGKPDDRFVPLYKRNPNKEHLSTRILTWFSSWKLGKV